MLGTQTIAFLALFTTSTSGSAPAGIGMRVPPAITPRLLDCSALGKLQLPSVKIAEAVTVAAAKIGAIKVAHCRVSGVIDAEIKFVELLPDRWNQRFFAGGGGGYVGAVDNAAETSVNDGYATVGTDTGHEGTPIEAGWALGNKERQRNFGYLAIHRTAEVAKAVVKAYYGQDPRYSYFYGCSNGGRQGLMEVQRYPADFDGVVSCAPALDWTNIMASFVRNAQVVFPRGQNQAVISLDNLKLIESTALATCDRIDGVKDGVLEDPRACGFKVASLPACAQDQPSAGCVTRTQRAAIDKIYAPTTIGGTKIYPGQPLGAEADPDGWPGWITGISPDTPPEMRGRFSRLQFAFATEYFKYFVFGRKDWDYANYDLAAWAKDTKPTSAILNADNPDLAAFKARGGKLILAHGWADPALNALSTIQYYQRIEARDPRLREYTRLFMMPGVLHCGGGPGPDVVNWFAPIAEWVENGRAPESLLAQKLDSTGAVVNARPLCPYPQRAVYDGKGKITDASSYACKAP